MGPEDLIPGSLILNQFSPLHTFTPYIFKIKFHIVLSSMPKSPK